MDIQVQDLHACSRRELHAATEPKIPGRGGSRPDLTYSIAQSAEEEPEIPHASLFAGLEDDGTPQRSSYGGCENEGGSSLAQGHRLPTTAQCAVHLELLEAIFALQHRVIASGALDCTFGLSQHIVPIYYAPFHRTIEVRSYGNGPAFAERRKVKWEFFVQAAAARFEAWWTETCASPPRWGQEGEHRTPSITHANLPPLDVLMIWHSFLLNPGMYHGRCAEAGLLHLLDVPFPWASVHSAINSRDRTFTLNGFAESNFTLNTGYEADLLAFLSSDGMANAIDKSNFRVGNGLKSSAGLRRLQSALYTDFTSELVAAFSRQVDFTAKMALKYVWLRSPAASFTINRATSRYPKFLALFRLHPRTLIVPTLDIDLVWHTHQLSPAAYRAAVVDLCGRFVDHDAGLAKEVLAGGWGSTVRLWEARWRTEYNECMCWDCGALAAEVERIGCSKADMDVERVVEKVVKKVKADMGFYRAVEIARRKGGMLPSGIHL